ncbi:unnamed protein product, partial [Brenthis ino]
MVCLLGNNVLLRVLHPQQFRMPKPHKNHGSGVLGDDWNFSSRSSSSTEYLCTSRTSTSCASTVPGRLE